MADVQPKAPPSTTLSDTELAKRINDHLKEMEETTKHVKQTVLQQALYLGDLLLQAKAKVGHGPFGKWIERNTDLSERSAQRYMQLKEGWPRIEAWLKDNSATVADLSLRRAEKIIALADNSNSDDGPDASDLYDRAQDNLIKKLQKLDVNEADAAAEATTKELKKTVATMKAGSKSKAA